MSRKGTTYAAAASLLMLAPASTAAAQSGWGIGVVDREIYFADLGRGRVVKLARDGALRVLLRDIHCHNLAPGYDGAVYGEAVGENAGGAGDAMAIWRATPSGTVEYVHPATATPAPGAWIARDAAGNSYSWSAQPGRRSQIVKRTPGGEASVLAGGAWGHADGHGEAARFAAVGGLAVTRDAAVYVIDSGHLRRVSAEGAAITLARDIVSTRTGGIPGRGDLFNHSMGVAVAVLNGEETVLIVDHYNQRVVAWSASRGARVLHSSANWLSRMTGDNGLGWYIRGVAFSGDDIYVLEDFTSPPYVNDLAGTPRIRRVASDGASRVVASVASWPLRLAALLATAALGFASRSLSRGARRPKGCAWRPGCALGMINHHTSKHLLGRSEPGARFTNRPGCDQCLSSATKY